jgi:protein SCO1/2
MFFGNPGRLMRENQTADRHDRFVQRFWGPCGGSARADRASASAEDRTRHTARRRQPTTPPREAVQPLLTDIPLVDQGGRPTTLRDVMDTEQALLVNFIFTTCTTVCPVMTRGFAQLNEALGPERRRVRLVSISIDPEQDTVDNLRRYGSRYGAGDSWLLLTGTREASVSAQRAFGAYRGDKMSHAPATYVRRTRGASWAVIDGLASGDTLESALHEPDRPGDR